jgi:acetyl-CoA carboxylase biotin carboxylase subunit
MGIASVAVYSRADENSLHIQLADQAIFIGESPAQESYLNMEAIIAAAIDTHCDAIHPGYGFLSENHEFNWLVREAGIVFIGSQPESMKLLGSKLASRKTMIDAGIPVVPGMESIPGDIQECKKFAEEIGYPVMIKASDGGGGKGMRKVSIESDLESALEAARRESLSAFGSDVIYIEKYLESPHHVEIQVAADNFGNAVHMFERECSIQRRHQKIIEETPSPFLDETIIQKMGETAIKAIKAAGYDNIGTVEFLVDKEKNFYFLEVNTRIQVEHPITEMTTGIDLVKLQIRLAAGEKLPMKQEDIHRTGHAIECRIYGEDSDNSFLPSSGKILFLKEPSGPGIRLDMGIKQGSEVSVYYDPILSKLIAYGNDREEARKRMILALKEMVILGIKTPIGFLINVLENPDFISGNISTDFIDRHPDLFKVKSEKSLYMALILAALATDKATTEKTYNQIMKSSNPWLEIGAWEICWRATKWN